MAVEFTHCLLPPTSICVRCVAFKLRVTGARKAAVATARYSRTGVLDRRESHITVLGVTTPTALTAEDVVADTLGQRGVG